MVAGALAYALGVKLADAMNVEFYTDVATTLPDPVLLAPLPALADEATPSAAARQEYERFDARRRDFRIEETLLVDLAVREEAQGVADTPHEQRLHDQRLDLLADNELRRAAADIDEGADIVMVKPAGPYLDVIRMVRDNFDVPVAAYQVSGEYAMICAAAERGWLDRDAMLAETVTSIVRAGADIVLTYAALELARR